MVDPFVAYLFGGGIESVGLQNMEVHPFDVCIIIGRPLLKQQGRKRPRWARLVDVNALQIEAGVVGEHGRLPGSVDFVEVGVGGKCLNGGRRLRSRKTDDKDNSNPDSCH